MIDLLLALIMSLTPMPSSVRADILQAEFPPRTVARIHGLSLCLDSGGLTLARADRTPAGLGSAREAS